MSARPRASVRIVFAAAATVVGAAAVALLRIDDASAPRVPRHETPASSARDPATSPAFGAASPAPQESPRAASGVAAVPATSASPLPGRRILFLDAAPREGTPAEIARSLVVEHRAELGLTTMPGELVVKREFDGLSGHHLRYEQRIDGVPVFGSEVSAHVAKDGRPLLVAADVFPVEGAETTPALNADDARASAASLLAEESGAFESNPPRLVVLPCGRLGSLAWLVEARTADESARVFVDAKTGDPLRADDLRRSADGAAEVFVPNPVYSQRDPSLRDGYGADSPALTAARVRVALHRLDGTGYLRGAWADVTLTRAPSFSATLDWTSITRSNWAFAQAMAYFHVDAVQQRLQDLGISGANARQTAADAHAFAQDNSYYDGFDKALHFGNGGVDDAEDGDVVHHEYGHAMQDDQVPDFGLVEEGGAMGEGFGDFQAVSFHASGDPTYDPLFASWDATSFSSADPPYVRRVDGSKVYPRDMDGEVHDDGEIWSRFLWDLRGLVGNDESLKIVVESHFFLSPSARFVDGANAVLAADASLRGGADAAAIKSLLDARGLPYERSGAQATTDDPFEPNNDAAHAAALAPGFHPGLVLADDDWYRLDVPPDSRLHVTATYDPTRVALASEIVAQSGATLSASSSIDGTATTDASAGPEGATVLLHVSGAKQGAPAPYDLAVTAAALTELKSGKTRLVTLADGGDAVFAVQVGARSARRHAAMRVAVRGVGRGGAVADLRIYSPSGRLVALFGDHRTATGASVPVRVDEAGAWIVEMRPRGSTSGVCAVKAKVD